MFLLLSLPIKIIFTRLSVEIAQSRLFVIFDIHRSTSTVSHAAKRYLKADVKSSSELIPPPSLLVMAELPSRLGFIQEHFDSIPRINSRRSKSQMRSWERHGGVSLVHDVLTACTTRVLFIISYPSYLFSHTHTHTTKSTLLHQETSQNRHTTSNYPLFIFITTPNIIHHVFQRRKRSSLRGWGPENKVQQGDWGGEEGCQIPRGKGQCPQGWWQKLVHPYDIVKQDWRHGKRMSELTPTLSQRRL